MYWLSSFVLLQAILPPRPGQRCLGGSDGELFARSVAPVLDAILAALAQQTFQEPFAFPSSPESLKRGFGSIGDAGTIFHGRFS